MHNPLRRIHYSVIVAVLLAVVFCQAQPRAYTQTTCPLADPYDNYGDSDELNNCLDNYDVVLLEPSGGSGYVGYIIDDIVAGGTRAWGGTHVGLELNSYNVIAPSGEGGMPLLIADPGLLGPMISTVTTSEHDFEIHGVVIDGNRDNRVDQDCEGYRAAWSNAVLFGDSFQIIGISSTHAVCGSAMELNSVSNFEVSSSSFVDNGAESGGEQPWADGLTLNDCYSGVVYYNYFGENTDLGIALQHGEYCYIAHNVIENYSLYAYGGAHLARCDMSCQMWDNEVYAAEDEMGVGMAVGQHLWFFGSAFEVGEVYENVIDGAVINLWVDGLTDAVVASNSTSNAQGSRGLNSCSHNSNYAAAHIGSATLDSGWEDWAMDGGGTGPCGPA